MNTLNKVRLVSILCLLAIAGTAHARSDNVHLAPDGTFVGNGE